MNFKGFLQQIEENMIFRLNDQRSPKDVKLLHLEWAVITQLDGEKSVGDIADSLALNQQETKEIFQKLWKVGLLEYSSSNNKNLYVSEGIINDLEFELTVLLGPISNILIDDTFKILKRKRRNLEKQNLPIFIDLLTNQISESEKKLIFQKNLLTKISSYIFN